MSSFSSATVAYGVSLLAVPATYGFNTVAVILKWDSPSTVCFGATVVFVGIAVLLVWTTGRGSPLGYGRRHQILFYLLAMLAFTSVAALTVGLELDGMISGFVSVYLKVGEPYLRCGHGAMTSYWHGTAMYALHLMMIAALTWDNDFYEVALYWCGAAMNSTTVLLLSVATGKLGATAGCAFYVPFALIAPSVLYCLRYQKSVPTIVGPLKPLMQRPADLLFLAYLAFASVLAIVRAVAALGTHIWWIGQYIDFVEPYLQQRDPAPFPQIQMLIYLFHHMPLNLLCAYGLIVPGCHWMPDLTMFLAGATLQGQVTHIGASFHPRTPYILRVPQDFSSCLTFWSVNIPLAIIPQFFAYRCQSDSHFFAMRSEKKRS